MYSTLYYQPSSIQWCAKCFNLQFVRNLCFEENCKFPSFDTRIKNYLVNDLFTSSNLRVNGLFTSSNLLITVFHETETKFDPTPSHLPSNLLLPDRRKCSQLYLYFFLCFYCKNKGVTETSDLSSKRSYFFSWGCRRERYTFLVTNTEDWFFSLFTLHFDPFTRNWF